LGRFRKVLLGLTAVGFAGLGLTSIALAYTNPELLELVAKIAEYGLEGLKAYFDFLIELFKEAVAALV